MNDGFFEKNTCNLVLKLLYKGDSKKIPLGNLWGNLNVLT